MNYDYGLAARFHDPITGQLVVVVAGLGENGTVAAGRFVAGEKYMDDLKKAKQFPRGDQNFEAVVASQIIDGKPGPPPGGGHIHMVRFLRATELQGDPVAGEGADNEDKD
jgi:hypothetical protein